MTNQCECSDRGCAEHEGKSSCREDATITLYRVDMVDASGIAMCEGCADDAMDSGVFTTDDSVNADEPNEDDEAQEPEKDDIVTTDHQHFYQSGKLYTTVYEGEDWQEVLHAKMSDDMFWPNVWFISDHGNAHLLSLYGEA